MTHFYNFLEKGKTPLHERVEILESEIEILVEDLKRTQALANIAIVTALALAVVVGVLMKMI